LRSIGGSRDFRKASGDLVECVVPRDGLELSAPLWADTSERFRKAVGVIGALDVSIHFRAEKSLREWMFGIASDAHGASVLDGDEHRARVGAVVRARGTYDARTGWHYDRSGHDITSGARVEYSATCRLPAPSARVRRELPRAHCTCAAFAAKRLRCLMLNR
jgi:hypothetical protein